MSASPYEWASPSELLDASPELFAASPERSSLLGPYEAPLGELLDATPELRSGLGPVTAAGFYGPRYVRAPAPAQAIAAPAPAPPSDAGGALVAVCVLGALWAVTLGLAGD